MQVRRGVLTPAFQPIRQRRINAGATDVGRKLADRERTLALRDARRMARQPLAEVAP